ncbi:uncharacterized protein LOC122884924 [Siniperca chuatsi]|uniref:uncharacterized protein LOC122884924 n=1 Tax=Siniperca chuatsi TaxID=119488 RepID=UPI001CE1C40C|nr:uncharacterized protein LOC122884924 [Siniperca chuatsi]
MDMDKQGSPKMICREVTNLKTIKIFASRSREFTAEDLLNMSLPFGYVVSVQKIVKNGITCGVVTYSNADDAAVAVIKLNDIKGFLVGLSKPREVREAHATGRSESQSAKPPRLLKDRFSDMPPQRLPSLLDTLYPPAYSQTVCLHIGNLPRHVDQRYRVLSLLPANTTNVKVEKRRALVTLPDISTALWLMDFLNDLYTGSKRLRVSFAHHGGAAYPATRAARRKHHHQHRGLL